MTAAPYKPGVAESRAVPAEEDEKPEDEDDIIPDDEVASGDSSGEDEWDFAQPSIFNSGGERRFFRVAETIKITSSYRPSFQFSGCVVETRGGENGAGPASEATIESNLTLSLQYEPPSPKFTRQCPDRASYRLKVSRGADFLYSTRGMHKVLQWQGGGGEKNAAVWGELELCFTKQADLQDFLAALKYVDVRRMPAAALPVVPESSPPPAPARWRRVLRFALKNAALFGVGFGMGRAILRVRRFVAARRAGGTPA